MPADWAMNARLFLKPGAKKKRREKFERNTALVIEAAVMNTDALDEWARSRYDIEPAYLLPLGFTYTRAEAPEEWLNTTDLEQILYLLCKPTGGLRNNFPVRVSASAGTLLLLIWSSRPGRTVRGHSSRRGPASKFLNFV
jgi:hypothetical protein